MAWKTIERPGFFGRKRDERYRGFDARYGEGKWRIGWVYGIEVLPFVDACKKYEEGYFRDSYNREDVWIELIGVASDVYDHDPSNVKSGYDYMKQEGTATHLQDIAVRNVVRRRGWNFRGSELVQVRSHASRFGKSFSPGKIPFHEPERIVEPHLKGWWDYNSIEDFWQSNKVLQALED